MPVLSPRDRILPVVVVVALVAGFLPAAARDSKSVFSGLPIDPDLAPRTLKAEKPIRFEPAWSFAGFPAPLAGDLAASDTMLAGTDVDGPFDGAVELGDRLAGSTQVARCYATQWFRFGYGRGESSADACSLQQLSAAFTRAKGNVRELLVALTQTDAFRFRRGGAP